MENTSKKTASCTLEETLERLNVSDGTTFPTSLFRSKKSGQVLYLEAGKDFVDTLLSFLLLPLGTIVHMLAAGILEVKPALGGISSIFESVQNFSYSDLQVAKEFLVRPRPVAIGCKCRSSDLAMQRALEDASILPRRGFAYSLLAKEVGDTIGFVKANTTFIVTDNLEITPLTMNKSVNVLSKLNVDSLADLEGNDITVTLTQILQLLNSALTSNNCLTEVFGKSK